MIGGDGILLTGGILVKDVVMLGAKGRTGSWSGEEGEVGCAGIEFDTLESGDGVKIGVGWVGGMNREWIFSVAVGSDFVSGGLGEELAKSFRAFHVSLKEGGDGLEDDAEFSEVGTSSREKNVVGVGFSDLEDRSRDSNFGEGRATLVVTEEDGVKDRGEDLVELGVDEVRGSVGGLVQ
jgi:hypothetical protein